MTSLEHKIASNLFAEYHNRIGALTGPRPRGKTVSNIIDYGLLCMEIGRNLELDELRAYLAKRDATRNQLNAPARDALQATEDEIGIERHLTS